MDILSETPEIIALRKQALSKILATHPHACLTCAQKEGCSRTSCSSNVAEDERCCVLLGRCEIGKVSEYIGIPGDTPKYKPENLPIIKDDPLFDRDYNICIGCLRCVRVCRDVRGADILGAALKNDRVWVGTLKPGNLIEAECRFCGACVEVCPTGALLDKDDVPKVSRDASLPCTGGCPAGIDIPGYLKLISLGHYKEALELIRTRAPFPGILGYVCFHPCESACRRGNIDQAVAICSLKRFVADEVPLDQLSPVIKNPDTGKKVAIIGSGPAGLTAAYYLNILGHHIDIFDEDEKPGGMLRHGIPAYRLPDGVLDRELANLEQSGINFKMNQKIGHEFNIEQMKSDGYDALLVAIGTSDSRMLGIENENLEGIYPALDFLKSAKSENKPSLNGKVVVIGGGNVAIDAAMTSLRLGAEHVTLVCLESRQEMPAHDWEIAQAEEEGIEIINSRGPIRFGADNGRVSSLEFKKCVSVFDEQRRFNPSYDESDIITIDADFAIVAIGQQTRGDIIDYFKEKQKTAGSLLKVNNEFSTGIDGIFAAGDAVKGPSSVVEAIAAGRKSAEAIDKYLGGSGVIKMVTAFAEIENPRLESNPESMTRSRRTGKVVDPASRKRSFCAIEETLEESAAKLEAKRCLQCHLRQRITPIILPPELWLSFETENVDKAPEAEGVFRLLDSGKKAIKIKGTANLRKDLLECLENPGAAVYFEWEEDPMYTKRESELIQKHLQEFGEMPGGGVDDELDDLF